MKKIICESYEELSREAAKILCGEVQANSHATLGLATGSTPIGAYQEMVKMYQAGAVDFKDVTTFNLDEYYKIDRTNDQSYYYFMHDNLFNHINIKEENINIPNGMVDDPEAECKAYDEKIEKHGGIDLQLLGVGVNGHVGFNEPADEMPIATHLTPLTQGTIEVNARFFDKIEDVPTQALTLGLKGIMAAKKILVLISGESKKEAAKKLFSGVVTTSCPVTLLNLHNDVTVILDRDAAQLL